MINEKDVFDVLLAVERTNADNIGTKVTCAKIRELVKKLIDRRLDDMADEHEAEVMAGYYAKKKSRVYQKIISCNRSHVTKNFYLLFLIRRYNHGKQKQ